jgi:hypothetical protein
VLHKPKGLWVAHGLLWTTDIDSAWVFDLKSKKGRQVMLPGAVFANDVVVAGDKLFVSDSATGLVYLVEPADFRMAAPQVSRYIHLPGQPPNGLAIKDGKLILGTSPRDKAGEIHQVSGPGASTVLQGGLGRIDGLAVLADGSLLFTDWAGGGLFLLPPGGKARRLDGGYGGPADFALLPKGKGYLVVVPDLVKGDIRFIMLQAD